MFRNSNEFSLHIEKLAKENKLSYVDAVLHYCETNYIEPEDIKKLINISLKNKIETEMIDMNYLPKKAKLDV